MNRGKTSKGKKQFYAELLTTSRDKNSKVRSFLEESPGVSVYEGQSKVRNLDDAIKEYVEPGMSLYVGEGANALEYGLARQFLADGFHSNSGLGSAFFPIRGSPIMQEYDSSPLYPADLAKNAQGYVRFILRPVVMRIYVPKREGLTEQPREKEGKCIRFAECGTVERMHARTH